MRMDLLTREILNQSIAEAIDAINADISSNKTDKKNKKIKAYA